MTTNVKSSQHEDVPSLLPTGLAAKDIALAMGWPEVQFSRLAGDGSARLFYRLWPVWDPVRHGAVYRDPTTTSAVLMWGAEPSWRQARAELESLGVRVPAAHRCLGKNDALIIEDLGDASLDTALTVATSVHPSAVDDLYDQAFHILEKIVTSAPNQLPSWRRRSFTAAQFQYELNFFSTHFLQHTDLALDPQGWEGEVQALAAYLASLPQWTVHRDFHARNLMLKKPGDLCVIDFQDGRLGPASYDLVSLIFDAYAPLSLDKRYALFERALALPRLPKQLRVQWQASWQPMLLQRQLKALGSFAYLTHTKKRGDYLKFAPTAIATLQNLDPSPYWPTLSRDLCSALAALS